MGQYQFYIERFEKAIQRESFNRHKENNHTPISIINSNKYIIEIEGKEVFILTAGKIFEDLILVAFKIARTIESKNLRANELLQRIYHEEAFRNLFTEWGNNTWTADLEAFINHLKEESFFYVDDGSEGYYFKLFSLIEKNDEFTGGFFHFLVKHFEHFSKFHPNSNDSNLFQYNTLISQLIYTSIFGTIVEKENKPNQNYIIRKEIKFKDKILKVGLYYDKLKQLFFVNTFYMKTIKNTN